MFPVKNPAVTTLTWFGSLVLIMSFAVVLANAGAAMAANISYVGSDGNVWRMSPDGARKEKLTSDGTADARYKTPSQKDDGTVVAVRRADAASSTAFAYFIRPSDGTLLTSWILPKTGAGSFAPFNGGVISPDGGAFFYDWSYFDCWTNPCSSDFKVSVITGPGVTNPCLVNCHSGFIRPRWIPGTPYAGFVDDHFQAVWVQGAGQAEPRSWLGFDNTTSGNVESFDIAAGKSVVEVTDEGGDRSAFLFWDNNGTPPAGNPTIRCSVADVAKAPAYPRLSPDGTQLTWQDTSGVYVAPVPTQTGGSTCQLNWTRIADGGKEPSWGKASLEVNDPSNPSDPSDPNDPNDPDKPGARPVISSLKATPVVRVRRGKSARLTVTVAATGKAVTGLKVCATVPKESRKSIRLAPCSTVQSLAAGATTKVNLNVRTTKKAKGIHTVTVSAAAPGVAGVTSKAKVKVQK